MATNYDKIKYLSRYRWLNKEIDRKLVEKNRFVALACRVSPVVSMEPKGGGSIYKQSDIVAKIVDLEIEINDDIDELLVLKKEIEQVISSVDNPPERLLLKYRYIDGLRWEKIAVNMGYSYRQTLRQHSRILEKMSHNVT